MRRAAERVAALLGTFLGTLSWQPPSWLKRLKLRSVTVGGEGVTFLHAIFGSRRFARIVGGITLATLTFAVGCFLWSRAPKPVEITVQITTPGLTAIREGALPDNVHIHFGGSAARLEQVDKLVAAGITMDPPIEGQWQWHGDSRLTFTPKNDWPIGETVEVELAKELAAEHVRLETRDLQFATPSFGVSFSQAEFHQDPVDPSIKKIVATLRFTHPVDTASFEPRLKMAMADPMNPDLVKNYKLTVSYDKYFGEAYVHSEVISIPLKDGNMHINLKRGTVAARGGDAYDSDLERQVHVPGRYNLFRIRQSQITLVRNERYEPEQVLIFETTAGVLESELSKNLTAWVLPKDRPKTEDKSFSKNYRWYNPAEVGPEVLRKSEKLILTPIPAEREYATQHTFKVKAAVGRHILVRINEGTEAYGGYLLAGTYDSVLRVPSFPKELEIMHDGAILSVTGDKRLSVLSRGLPGVRFVLFRVLPSEINHLITQSAGNFQSPYFRRHRFNESNVSEVFMETRRLDNSDPSKTQYTSVDFGKHLKRSGGGMNHGLFVFHAQGWNPKKKRVQGPSDRRLILLTDLGVVVKDDVDKNHYVFVQSIASGDPVGGTTVEILGKNGLPVLSKQTDESGLAKFPTLVDFKREKKPVAYLVRRGGDLSFLPFERNDRLLNYSRFDVGGTRTRGQAAKLNAYLFSDRGIYRPGDEFHIGVIVKSSDWMRPLDGVPIQTVVTDARGLEVYKKRLRLTQSGFVEVSYQPEESAPTGTYNVRAYIVKDNIKDNVGDGRRGAFLGATTVRVEEFLPDRMRITARFTATRVEGWVAPTDLGARVELRNLFGTPAANRRVAASISLTPHYPSFRGYRDYRFFDPMRAKRSYDERLSDEESDEEGNAEFDLDLSRFDKATYQLTFLAEGFEAEGGRGVTAQASIVVSPLEYLVGYKADGSLGYIKKGAERYVQLVAIGPDLKRVGGKTLRAVLVEQRYVSVLMRQSNGTYKYQSVLKDVTRGEKKITISAKGLKYRLPTKDPGRFVVVIRAANDTELNRIQYSVVGAANLSRDLERNAELQVRLNRPDYSVGDTIEVQINAPYVGAGLITIERDRVYAHKWFKTTTTSSVQTIRIPKGMEANGYVNVAFVRGLDSKEIFMSPLSYGVVPFSVSRKKRTIQISLEARELAKPGEPFTIGYATDKPSKIVVFAVDEGILQVAGYKTPDPLSHFLSKRALEVSTRQILDLILPEFSVVEELSSSGGGEEGEEALGKNLNPFRRKRDKPVVYWSGIIDASPKAKTVTYNVPDYFSGTLRVMAVAVAPSAIGVEQRKAFIRGPFVINPNTPTFVGPGDIFTASVAVANNIEGSGDAAKVQLKLAVTENLEILDEAERTLAIGEGREGTARFKIKAKRALGNAELRFAAKLGKKSGKFRSTLSVRPPMPYMTTLRTGSIKDDDVEITIDRKMYPHYRKLEVTVSPLPLGVARGLLSFLDRFPYGCTEQIVSQTVPSMLLTEHPAFGIKRKKAKENIRHTMRILQARQNSKGAFGFWAANSHISDFQAIYAMQFLTEANDRGYPVPGVVHKKGLKYLRKLSKVHLDSLPGARMRAYATYILARNSELATDEVASLREYLDKRHKKVWMKDLTAVYLAATYELMRDKKEANRLIKKAEVAADVQSDYDNYYDNQIYLGQYLYVLAKHFPERLEDLDGKILEGLVKGIERGSYNTLSSAYTLYGLEAYAKVAEGGAGGESVLRNVTIREKRGEKDVQPIAVGKGLFPKMKFSDQAKTILIESKSDMNVYYQITLAGFDLEPPKKVVKQKLELFREFYVDGELVDQADLGGEVEVHLKLRSTADSTLGNIAIVDLLPGGFDPVIGQGGSAHGRIATQDSTWTPQYADVREDRVVLFGNVGKRVLKFVYKMKATTRGEFIVPPTFGESMYDRTIKARSLGAKIKVVGQE